MKLIAGTSNVALAQDIGKYLDADISGPQCKVFSDKEMSVTIKENVRGKDTFVIQSTSTPVNDHLMELMITLDALKRASPKNVTAVIPYFGYARQDRKAGGRSAITAKMVADVLTTTGAQRILTMDLHAGQIEGFFNIPVDNLSAMPIMAADIRENFKTPLIISPDVGGVVRARALANKLGARMAIVDKNRPEANVSEVMNIIGDVTDCDCIMFDDIVDTAGTLCHAADALLDAGAKSVTAYVTHGVLSGPAFERIEKSKLKEVVITDTIWHENLPEKVRRVSVAKHFGEAIRRIAHDESVSKLNS